MPLDPRIPMGFRQPEFANPLDMALKGGKLAALMQGQQANELEMQFKQQQMDVVRRNMEDEQALRTVMQQTGGNPKNALAALLTIGTPKSVELAAKLHQLVKPEAPHSIGSGGLRLPDGTIIPPVFKPTEPKEPKPPTVHSFREGNKLVSRQWNSETSKWDMVSEGPAFSPNAGVTVNMPSSSDLMYDPEKKQFVRVRIGKQGGAEEVPLPGNLVPAPVGTAGLKGDLNLAGGRESVFINRVIMGANQAAKDLENVTKLPMSASRGFFGGRGQPAGLLNAGQETLTNTMTTQEVQSYNVLSTGFQRSLAAIESAGLAPNVGLSHQMEAVLFKEGDTNYTKLQKLAQTRQIIESGLETIVANPRVPEETRKHVQEVVTRVKNAVPFTQGDLIDLQSAQKIKPRTTLQDIINEKKSRGTIGGQGNDWTPEKERRYQELLNKQKGG